MSLLIYPVELWDGFNGGLTTGEACQ